MDDTPSRRRFLQLTGATATVSVAGCADLNPMSSDGPHADKVTAIVEPDTDDLEDLEEAVMAGEMDQMEAQEELTSLAADAIDSFEDRAADDDELVIEESETIQSQMGEVGLYLVDGEPASIIEALTSGAVSQLHGGPTYETILEQQQAAEQQQGGEEIDEEELEEIEEEMEEQLEEQQEAESDDESDADDE